MRSQPLPLVMDNLHQKQFLATDKHG